MNQHWLAIALFLTPCVATADALDDYMSLAVGEFSSTNQAATDARYDAITWQVAEIWAKDPSDARWLYTESWMDGADAPYMQRVSKITLQDDGGLLSERYRIAESKRVVGAWNNPGKFAQLGPADLVALAGCDAVLVRAGKGRFEGGTVGSHCRNGYKGASYTISHNRLTADGMVNWDRGFTADGEHVWGPAAGGYRFERSSADATCSRPVRMLVYGEITDREKFAAYGRAIGKSGLYPKTGGYYEAISPAIEVFEGDPPATRAVVIVRFPCEQAARDFWYSEDYEAIKPIREGISAFEVLLLRAPPVPAYVN